MSSSWHKQVAFQYEFYVRVWVVVGCTPEIIMTTMEWKLHPLLSAIMMFCKMRERKKMQLNIRCEGSRTKTTTAITCFNSWAAGDSVLLDLGLSLHAPVMIWLNFIVKITTHVPLHPCLFIFKHLPYVHIHNWMHSTIFGYMKLVMLFLCCVIVLN